MAKKGKQKHRQAIDIDLDLDDLEDIDDELADLLGIEEASEAFFDELEEAIEGAEDLNDFLAGDDLEEFKRDGFGAGQGSPFASNHDELDFDDDEFDLDDDD